MRTPYLLDYWISLLYDYQVFPREYRRVLEERKAEEAERQALDATQQVEVNNKVEFTCDADEDEASPVDSGSDENVVRKEGE